MIRIGHGFDVHAFGDGDAITLCGVTIAHRRALVAHSDGDVAIHALCDALLGAAALGDIGKLFPDSDPSYHNIDSRILLREVVDRLAQIDYRVANIDLTIIAQSPRLASHIDAMVSNLAADLTVERGAVNIKATTTERLGYCGREEGIACHAVVLLHRE